MAKHKHEEHENHERWLVSYADFITLLFAFFVVMYSVSSVNEGKFRVVSDSLQQALDPIRSPPSSPIPFAVGTYTPKSMSKSVEKYAIIKKKSEIVLKRLVPQGASVEHFDKKNQKEGRPKYAAYAGNESAGTRSAGAGGKSQAEGTAQGGDKGIVISLDDGVLFESGSAQLKPEALPLMEALAEVLIENGKEVKVDGHTDNVPIHAPLFPTNWELSTIRAVMVVRALSELYNVPAELLSATGYGDSRPKEDNNTPEGRAKNRRVELVISTPDEGPASP